MQAIGPLYQIYKPIGTNYELNNWLIWGTQPKTMESKSKNNGIKKPV